jgi:hypothetical protein
MCSKHKPKVMLKLACVVLVGLLLAVLSGEHANGSQGLGDLRQGNPQLEAN